MHCANLYPQNGDRIVTVDSVTSLHRVRINAHTQWSEEAESEAQEKKCWKCNQ